MWAIDNQTPFLAAFGWGQDPDGAKRWVVAVKASFLLDMEGGAEARPLVRSAPAQEGVHRAAVPSGARGSSPLLYETDLAPLKLHTDVLVHGRAYAPGGEPATSVDVALQVGRLSKRVRVFGDRRWEAGVVGLAPSPPIPFVEMPLGYERAFGGQRLDERGELLSLELRNPFGIGLYESAEEARGRPLPNLEDPSDPIRSFRDRPRPMSLGPIAASWEPRRSLAGTYDERWMRERRPFLPEDFQLAHHQHAPPDQQSERLLRGGEKVELLNLSPGGYLSFRLPKLTFGMMSWADKGPVSHPTRLHTVMIEPERRRVVLTWQSSLRVGRDASVLRYTRVYLKRRVGHVESESADYSLGAR